MSGNYFCHVCGGLVDLIKLQPSDVRLCECENRFARLRAENERLKVELAEAKKDAMCWYMTKQWHHADTIARIEESAKQTMKGK